MYLVLSPVTYEWDGTSGLPMTMKHIYWYQAHTVRNLININVRHYGVRKNNTPLHESTTPSPVCIHGHEEAQKWLILMLKKTTHSALLISKKIKFTIGLLSRTVKTTLSFKEHNLMRSSNSDRLQFGLGNRLERFGFFEQFGSQPRNSSDAKFNDRSHIPKYNTKYESRFFFFHYHGLTNLRF